MKYIHGFLSSRLKEVGISHDQSLVIRYLLNFINSNKMEKILVDGEFYYWVKYEKVVTDLDILGIKKQAISDMLCYDLGVKPNDWEERLNSMSASTRKKREKAKFLGIFKRYTKKDAEGTRSYFAPTDLLYSLLPNITEDDEDMKNKKASTVPPVKATNTNKNNIDIKDITLISYLSLISERENLGEEFEFPYSRIINDLPIIFNSKSYEANAVKLRRMLDKEGMKNFVTRDILKKGREFGTVVLFKLNKENILKLNVNGVVQ